jgi:hypothetical protein
VVCLSVGLIVGYQLGCARPQPKGPVVQTSLAIGDVAIERFVLARVKAIQWRTGTTDTLYAIDGPVTPNQTFTLTGRTPLSIPDHHGNTEIAVIDVSAGKAKLLVLRRFDHGSFGKNRVTIDCRVVELNVTSSDEAHTTLPSSTQP